MKKIVLIIILVIVFSLITGCTNDNESSKGYTTITAEEAKTIIDENPHAVILDVRTQEEYDEKHIPDSILLPNENISEETVSKLELDSNSIILIYCRSGNRSKEAASKLAELGYLKIYDFGGIKDWSYETE